MPLSAVDYEIPLLQALIELGGSAKPSRVYPIVEKIMKQELDKHPEEYGKHKHGQIVWINKIQWAREFLKKKGQLDASVRRIWTITQSGSERVHIFRKTGRDLDEGSAKIHGIDLEIEKHLGEVYAEYSTGPEPEEAFRKIEESQLHETGAILGVRGIVYEPINEQGVILLFAALAHDIDFMIEGIRSKFPDALLRRKNLKGRWVSIKAEFEYKSREFKTHGHDPAQCDLIICWEHDWEDCPKEVLCLKEVARKFKE